MYCPSCNLHSEEYADKCPLCNGPMEVDEVGSSAIKTPTPDKDESTEDLNGEEVWGIAEEEDPPSAQGERLYQQEFTPIPKRPGRKKNPL
ncbi:MAG: hypothetical protein JRJ08_05560, partial [Deltaproteobacteria bacterium]|nr:hypothetical protein [Deltaproteobacteria bacterium]